MALGVARAVVGRALEVSGTRTLATVVRGSTAYPVVIASHLNAFEITALFNKRIAAIVIPGFYPKDACKSVSGVLLSGKVKEYTNAPGIGRVGIAYYETPDNLDLEKEYFSTATDNIEALRRFCAPHPSPIDLVRLRLDEAWPYGGSLGRMDKKAMFAGLCRALEPGKEIFPHEDKLERDDASRRGRPLWGQIAANVYVQAAEEGGGALQLWQKSLPTAEYDALRGDSYGIARDKLPPPVVEIQPHAGDCVLFNSTNLHAVSPVTKTARLAVAQFIGCEGPEKPLKFWS